MSCKSSHSRDYKNIRRNTRAQKLPLHLPAVNSPGFCQGDGVATTDLCDFIYSGHNFKQSNHYNLVAVAGTKDVGKGKPGGIYYIRRVRGESGQPLCR